MSEVKVVAITERNIKWTPGGYSESKEAIIRDGKINYLPTLERYIVEADPDGAIEFLQAIKRAMAETRK